MKKALTDTAGLSQRSQAILQQVLPAKASPGRRISVIEVLRCLDRLNEVRDELNGTKSTATASRFGLIGLEIQLREQFLTMWRRLGLAFSPKVDGLIGIVDE